MKLWGPNEVEEFLVARGGIEHAVASTIIRRGSTTARSSARSRPPSRARSTRRLRWSQIVTRATGCVRRSRRARTTTTRPRTHCKPRSAARAAEARASTSRTRCARVRRADSAAESDDASFASLTSLGGYSSISLDAPPSLHGSSVAGDDAEFIDDPPRVMPRGDVVPLGRRCAITQIVRNEGLALHPNDGFTLVEQTALDEFNERLAGAAFDIASAQTDGGADDASAASLGSAVSSHASTLFSLNASMSARRAVLAHEAKAIAPSARVLEAGRRFKDVERDARKDIRTAPRPKEFEDEDDLDEEALAERREQRKEATRIGKQTPQPRAARAAGPTAP